MLSDLQVQPHSGFGQGWRLALPLFAILAIVITAGSLLLASRVFEHNRQEQGLVADTLWAEQAVSYEVTRMLDGIRSLGRSHDLREQNRASGVVARISSVMQRDPAILSIHIWSPQTDALSPANPNEEALAPQLREVASRASRLREPATAQVRGGTADLSRMMIAVPLAGAGGEVGVVVMSLQRLLQNTIPWWLAHVTQITLEDSAGSILAIRDENVHGRGLYTHKIATFFVDRTLYLSANSSQDRPVLIPNLQALAIASLSVLLAWTVYELWRDLGKRTRAEVALRAQHALQKAMEGAIVTGLCARDMKARITYANPAFCEMVGYSIEELAALESTSLGLSSRAPDCPTIRHEDPPSDVAACAFFERRFVRADGVSVDMQVHEAPLLDGTGVQIGWMASVQDISEQKRSAELLRLQGDRIQKMARLMTMGEMAAALAHELNQPLAAATSYLTAGLNLMTENADGRAPAPIALEYFDKARKQAQRAGEIIKKVRQFVGHSTPALDALHVQVVVKDLLPLVQLQVIDSGTSIAIKVDKHLPVVRADRVLLEQIILNLTKNSIEAVSQLGPSQKQVEIFATVAAAGALPAVILGVRDRGPGLGSESARILASSLTSAKPGGLGMGLAVCRKAAELLGTQLEYMDRPGGGAEFRIALKEWSGG